MLSIHILIVAYLRKLRPEGNIQAESELKCFFNVGMGHNAHRRSLASSLDCHVKIASLDNSLEEKEAPFL